MQCFSLLQIASFPASIDERKAGCATPVYKTGTAGCSYNRNRILSCCIINIITGYGLILVIFDPSRLMPAINPLCPNMNA